MAIPPGVIGSRGRHAQPIWPDSIHARQVHNYASTHQLQALDHLGDVTYPLIGGLRMRTLIGTTLLAGNSVQPRKKPFEIYDIRLAGFTLRVQPSGARSYYARSGRNRRISLGKVGSIHPDEARDQCQRILGNIASGRHPQEGLAGGAGMTLGRFLTETYEPWARANRPRTARSTLEKVRFLFKSWMAEPLSAITVERLELWKGRRLSSGIKPTTVLRELFALSSVLSRAVRVGQLINNPVRLVEKPRFDRRPRVRFLSLEEESRLRAMLADRDQQLIAARQSGNAHLHSRGKPALPELPHFGDHLTPAVLLSINTGLRMGETRRLRWDWIDLERRWLTVDGAHAKTHQTRHVPLNEEAHRILSNWREQAGLGKQVFQVATCFKTAWGHLLERAGIVGIPVARSAPSLCFTLGAVGRSAQHGARSARSRLGGHVAALCAPRSRPTLRSGRAAG